MAKKVLAGSAAVIFLSIAVTIVWKQAFTTYVTLAQVRRAIDDHLAVGSNESEVEDFIDSLTLDRVTVSNFGYQLNKKRFEGEVGMFDEKNRKWKDAAKGYLNARLENVGLSYFQPRCIDIRFYFDENNRLLDWDADEYFIGT